MSTWEERMSMRTKRLAMDERLYPTPPPERWDEDGFLNGDAMTEQERQERIDEYLKQSQEAYPMTEPQAARRLIGNGIACACAGSPLGYRFPCYCAMADLHAKAVLGGKLV